MHHACFFFFKQKTAYEMRISDWSSDVCSSDLGLRTVAQFDEFELAHLIGAGLPRRDDIALDCGNIVDVAGGAILVEPRDRTRTAPAQRMNAGVGDQSPGAHQFHRQAAELLPWIVIETHVQRKLLGVERPAFAERGIDAESREFGQPRPGARYYLLELMANWE